MIKRCLKHGVWNCGSTCRYICYIDWTSHTYVGPKITINVACTSLKHLENTAENDPRKEKTLLKEKVVILQLSKSHLFGKNLITYNWNLTVSKAFLRKVMAKTIPCRKIPCTAKWSNGDQNKNIRFQDNAFASARKFHYAGSASNGK